jgi:hypothetical protein
MPALNRYDGSLQMFVEDRRDPDMRRLRFLRWLAERGWLEHGVAGVPSGELCVLPARAAPDRDELFRSSALMT